MYFDWAIIRSLTLVAMIDFTAVLVYGGLWCACSDSNAASPHGNKERATRQLAASFSQVSLDAPVMFSTHIRPPLMSKGFPTPSESSLGRAQPVPAIGVIRLHVPPLSADTCVRACVRAAGEFSISPG